MSGPQLLQWWLAQRRPSPERFPYAAVVDAYRRHGKHFVPERWTRLLIEARNRQPDLGGSQVPYLAAFLSTVLDKADNRYDYQTYLALDLLPLSNLDSPWQPAARLLARRDRLHIHLLANLIAFEIAATAGTTPPLDLPPEPVVAAKRVRHALRAVLPAARRLGLAQPIVADQAAAARQIIAAVEVDLTSTDRLAMRVSMLPVSTVHDERMFIRVLQTFETTFALLAIELQAVIAAVQARRFQRAATRLSGAATLLRESAPLWSVMATLQPAAFHRFRPFTEGASAIQSRHYKLMESLCRTPDVNRRDAAAYRSVPDVRLRVLGGQTSLRDVLNDIGAGHDLTKAAPSLAHAMDRFSAALRQWRQTHYRLAVRMLGATQSGTGYTHGTAYLATVKDEPVFHRDPRDCPAAGDAT